MKLKLEIINNSFISLDEENQTSHISNLKALLKKALPYSFYENGLEKDDLKKTEVFFNENLPIIKWTKINNSKNISIILLAKHRKNGVNFFYDMVSRWLIFQKNLNVDLFYSIDFSISNITNDKLTLMQAIISVESQNDFDDIEKNRRTFETELRLGIVSDFHAKRITEFKGLSNDRKTAMVQEKIGALIQKRPKEYGKNIFSEMQQFLIMSRDEFKSQRDYHHISRIISILYMIRKLLKQNIEQNQDKRYVILKFLKTKLKAKEQDKAVLGVLVGINFLKEHEIFEKKHLISAIKNFLPYTQFVENSFFIDKASKNEIQTCYIEVQKPNGIDFTKEEISVLKEELPIYLKGNVEQLIHPVFMPRNEEEIVKNMLVLSQQLQYVHDIPQVIISFDKQTYTDISFNVILLRVLRPQASPLKDLISKIKSKNRFIIDKVKKVGIIRRKYLKEANVFRVLLESSNYLRSDHSLDINRARLSVLEELNLLFGEIRDYMGGMIYKQNEAYKSLQAILGQIGKHYDNLLEKFFYSITPTEMTAIVRPDILKNLFLMLINAIKREETRIKKHSDFLFKQESNKLYIMVPIYDQNVKKKIKDKIDNLNVLSSELVSFSLTAHDIPYLGYVFLTDDKSKQKIFFDSIQKSLSEKV
ncbi:MAG: hypothetical protein K1060chlam1_00476 [Candidatus Anoxychlamydiales bacterium]|nr:hypothetical protein [Candidatus Anoxychlamydiales bacterium]